MIKYSKSKLKQASKFKCIFKTSLKAKSKSYRGFFGGVELISSKLPDSSLMIEYNSFHPIVGLQHFFFNRFQVMVGAWDLKKLTLNLSYRYNL